MFRVYLNATSQHPRKEEWIEAVTGSPSWAGGHWDFLDAEGLFVSR